MNIIEKICLFPFISLFIGYVIIAANFLNGTFFNNLMMLMK